MVRLMIGRNRKKENDNRKKELIEALEGTFIMPEDYFGPLLILYENGLLTIDQIMKLSQSSFNRPYYHIDLFLNFLEQAGLIKSIKAPNNERYYYFNYDEVNKDMICQAVEKVASQLDSKRVQLYSYNICDIPDDQEILSIKKQVELKIKELVK